MIKKLCLVFVTLVVLALACGFGYWCLEGDRLKAEYAAYRRTGAPVLMYHGVEASCPKGWPPSLVMPTEKFAEQLRYLKEQGYTLVSVEQLAHRLEAGLSVDKYVALSFDDGYKDNVTVVLPLLQKYDAKASFFVVNRLMGKENYMDETDIKKLLAAGMELGSHSYSHNQMADIDEKYLVWETDTSRYWLKKKFDGYIVRTLAYPNGSYNTRVIEAARKYGFYRALTGHIGLNTPITYKQAPMEMYRVTVTDDGKGLEGFKQRLEDAYLYGFLQSKGININPLRDIFVKGL